jgi:hypothetical protein
VKHSGTPSEMNHLEYEFLNKEIADNTATIYTILNICVVGTVTLIGFILNYAAGLGAIAQVIHCPVSPCPPFLFLTPFLIIAPSALSIKASLKSTARIATYIQVFYESNPINIAWQTNMQKWRAQAQDNPTIRGHMTALERIFAILAWSCIGLSILSLGYEVLKLRLSPVGTNPVRALWWTPMYLITLSILILAWKKISKGLSNQWDYNAFQHFVERWKGIRHEETI